MPDAIASIVDGSSVRIVDYAVVPSVRTSPSYAKNTAIGVVIGIILSCAVIICMELFDETVRSEDYLTQTYPDIPLLAVIPDMASGGGSGYGSHYGYAYSADNKSGKGGKK
jgi:capsular polysaccharide biosynthesis protein